jgi:hypothetical protein
VEGSDDGEDYVGEGNGNIPKGKTRPVFAPDDASLLLGGILALTEALAVNAHTQQIAAEPNGEVLRLGTSSNYKDYLGKKREHTTQGAPNSLK